MAFGFGNTKMFQIVIVCLQAWRVWISLGLRSNQYKRYYILISWGGEGFDEGKSILFGRMS